MLSTATVIEQHRSAARSAAEFVPAMLMITDSLILNKNGSLTAAFAISGVDLEGKLQPAYDAVAVNQEQAFAAFDDCVTLDQYVDRDVTSEYPVGEFADDVSRAIDAVWSEQFSQGQQFRNRLLIFFTYTPRKTGDGLFDRVAAMVTQHGVSWWQAVGVVMKRFLSVGAEMRYTADEISTFIRQFEEQLGSYASAYTSGRINRMTGAELLGALHQRVNFSEGLARVRLSDAPLYLDSQLCSTGIERDPTSAQRLMLTGERVRYAAALTVKEWPAASYPGMMDYLLSLPCAFSLHHSFRFVSSQEADRHCTQMEKHHRDLAVKFKDMIRQGVTGREPDQLDEGRMTMSADAAAARASIVATGERFGWYHFSVVCYGESVEQVEQSVAEISKAIARFEIVALRESMGLLSVLAGTIPGNADILVRWFFFSASAFANLIHLRTVSSGRLDNPHYSEQAKRAMPALAAFPTQHNTPFFFNTHIDDLGHAMIIGPPGAGKTVMACFLQSQFRKYPDSRIYVFDKDRSCRIATLMHDGQHIDLTAGNGGGRMNPFALLGERDAEGRIVHFDWLSRFTRYLLEALSESRLSAADGDYAAVEQALTLAADLRPELHNLSTVASGLPAPLRLRIQPWLRGQEKGHFFDNDADSFDLGTYSCIEMGALLERDPTTAMAVLDYAVHRITEALADGSVSPTLIYIEEVWFMLKNPRFEAIIENWLRVLRKKNAVLWFATQSLSELAGSEISAAIINSIPTKIFLPNEEVRSDLNYDLYTRSFGLNDAQVEQIQRGVRKRNYLMYQGSISRMVWAQFDPTILACLRSDGRAQKVFQHWFERRDQDAQWKRRYIEEICDES